MDNYVGGKPGIKTARTAYIREILLTTIGVLFLPVGKLIKGSVSRDPGNSDRVDILRAGLLMGKRTSDGLYAPSVLGVLAQAYDKDGSANTTMVVSAAVATELVRRIGASGTFKVTGPPTAGGTVATVTVTYSAVNTSTGAVTVSVASADLIAGSFVQPADGSETILTVLTNKYGIKVTDDDDNDIDEQFPDVLLAGMLDASQIVNYPTDTSLKAWVKAQLRANGAGFIFDDDY